MKWLRSLWTGRIDRHTPKLSVPTAPPRPRLALEALEDRCLLSNGISVFSVPVTPPTTFAGPLGITAGPDGNLWFTDQVSGSAGKITPAGVVTEYPTSIKDASGDAPLISHNIVTGPDGNLWFTNYKSTFQHTGFPRLVSQSEVVKVTPAGVVTEFKLPDATSGPLGIAVGTDGKLWFTESRANKIGSITTDGTIQEFAVPPIDNGQSNPFTVLDIITGPDGNLWYTEIGSKVGRITTKGASLGEVSLSAPARGITAGPDGNVWITETNGPGFDTTANAIGRITPAGTLTEFKSFLTPGVAPDGITTGPDGDLWFTEEINLGPTLIGSIRPDGGFNAELTVPADGGTSYPSITNGPRGTLWFTEFFRGNIGVVHNYVGTLFQNVLGRPASQGDQNYWNNVRGQSGQAAVANGIQGSDEAHTHLVNGGYQTYLGRTAEAGGLQFFVNLLRTATEEQALARLFASPEYYTHAPTVPGVGGGTPSDTTYIQGLFQQLLGRAARADELPYWQAQVGTQGRAAVALLVQGSDEYRRDSIQDAYRTLLHRTGPASQAEVNYWMSLNLDHQRLKVAFEQTEEFLSNG